MSDGRSNGDGQRSILVVEDDPTMTELLRILLEDSGYRILAAERGEDALDLVRQHLPDLITLDLGLPDIDGREVLRRIRNDPDTGQVPVIVVTGARFIPMPEENVAAVLAKPFDVVELEAVVRRVLALASDGRSQS